MLRSSPSLWEPSPRSRWASYPVTEGADVASRAPWLAFLTLTAALALSMAPASGQGPIFATITGPPAAAASTATIYNLTINGGPSGSVNYTVKWYITGSDTSGGVPIQSNPRSASGATPEFKLN